VTLLIPVTYNDGTAVSDATLEAIEDEIFVAFNGWSIVGEVAGAYRMQTTGAKQVDRLLQVWVVVDEGESLALRTMVSRFGALRKQEMMYFEAADSSVEFLPAMDQEKEP
jgi:hypothetical protein